LGVRCPAVENNGVLRSTTNAGVFIRGIKIAILARGMK
jgi:hypothetical protein